MPKNDFYAPPTRTTFHGAEIDNKMQIRFSTFENLTIHAHIVRYQLTAHSFDLHLDALHEALGIANLGKLYSNVVYPRVANAVKTRMDWLSERKDYCPTKDPVIDGDKLRHYPKWMDAWAEPGWQGNTTRPTEPAVPSPSPSPQPEPVPAPSTPIPPPPSGLGLALRSPAPVQELDARGDDDGDNNNDNNNDAARQHDTTPSPDKSPPLRTAAPPPEAQSPEEPRRLASQPPSPAPPHLTAPPMHRPVSRDAASNQVALPESHHSVEDRRPGARPARSPSPVSHQPRTPRPQIPGSGSREIHCERPYAPTRRPVTAQFPNLTPSSQRPPRDRSPTPRPPGSYPYPFGYPTPSRSVARPHGGTSSSLAAFAFRHLTAPSAPPRLPSHISIPSSRTPSAVASPAFPASPSPYDSDWAADASKRLRELLAASRPAPRPRPPPTLDDHLETYLLCQREVLRLKADFRRVEIDAALRLARGEDEELVWADVDSAERQAVHLQFQARAEAALADGALADLGALLRPVHSTAADFLRVGSQDRGGN